MGSDRIRRTTSRSRAKAATTPVRVVRDREGRDPHLQMMISAGAIQALLHMADRAVELGMWHAGPSFAPALARTEDQARRLVHRGKDGGLSAVWHCNCGARKAVGSLPERAGTYTATCRRGRAEQSRAAWSGVQWKICQVDPSRWPGWRWRGAGAGAEATSCSRHSDGQPPECESATKPSSACFLPSLLLLPPTDSCPCGFGKNRQLYTSYILSHSHLHPPLDIALSPLLFAPPLHHIRLRWHREQSSSAAVCPA